MQVVEELEDTGGNKKKKKQQQVMLRANTKHMSMEIGVTGGIESLEDFRERLDRYLVHTVMSATPVKVCDESSLRCCFPFCVSLLGS